MLGLLALSCERDAAGARAAGPGSSATPQGTQPPRFDLERQVARLEAGGSVVLEPGAGELYLAYVALREGAAGPELRQLLQHASAVVRAYAFQALAEREPESSLLPELLVAIDDVAVVQRGGGRSEQSTVADLALERVQHRLTASERDVVARRLLAAGTPLRFAARIKREWTLGPELHEALRELARGGDGEALPALARYHDPADIPLLLAGLREPTLEQALQAIAEFPDASFVPPLEAVQRELLRAPRQQPGQPSAQPSGQRRGAAGAQLVCQLYATALRFPAEVAAELLAAPFARGVPAAELEPHLTCQRWLLQPALLREHAAAGFRLWEHNAGLLTEQLEVLWAADPARARSLTLAGAAELGPFSPDTIAWLLQHTDGAERAAVLHGLREGLRRAGKAELENLADALRKLQLRELLPELFARLERSRPLADADMATFRAELTRPLVWQISRWPLSEEERRRLLTWVVGGRAARERDTKDPIGQRIVEDYLVEVLARAGLLQPG